MSLRGGILLAFDDALESTGEAFSVLQPAGIVATIPTNPASVDEGVSSYDGTPLLSWAELDDMVSAGWELTNHGHTHADLQTLTNEQVEAEVVDAKTRLAARGHDNYGFLHYVVAEHKTSETIRNLVMAHSVTCRDTSTTNEGMTLRTATQRRALKSRLFQTNDMQATFDYMTACVTSGSIAFIHTHGGDTNYWGQMRDFIVAEGYVDDCLTMTTLMARYRWLWDRPQPLINAMPGTRELLPHPTPV